VHSVLYFPLEVMLCIRHSDPVKVLLVVMHNRNYCTRVWFRGNYSTQLHLVLYLASTTPLCNIPVVH